jgi:hypothetical protein
MADDAQLRDAFVANRIAFGLSSDKFDYKVGNKLYDKGQEILKKVWASSDHGRSLLTELSVSAEPHVALGAAVGLLPIDESLAIERLILLEKSANDNVAFDARMCLSEWEKGGLNNVRNFGET